MSGVSFLLEPGAGYLSRERLFLIEKSCAGLNFMIAVFAMLAFVFRRYVTSLTAAAVVLVGCVAVAYSFTVVVNAIRIVLAAWLLAHSPGHSLLTPAQSHRLEGIAIYFVGLVLVYELSLRLADRAACTWRNT